MSQLFASGGQCIGASASASVLPVNIQGSFPLELSGLMSLLSKGHLQVFSSTTVEIIQFLLLKFLNKNIAIKNYLSFVRILYIFWTVVIY